MNKTASLPANLLAIIEDKGTEPPYSSAYYEKAPGLGTYICRRCGLALYRSETQFHSGCGWPSFDQEVAGSVTRLPDRDGMRTEIICSRCHAHLGHVFTGEQFTSLNTRHCVNALSFEFVSDANVSDTEEAIFAAGCFWGVEHLFKQLQGVLKTEVGYTGGSREKPSYEQVCSGATGHYEAIRVLYDPQKINYQQLVKYFFEIHNFEQRNGQGPDIGTQYQSVIFYYDDEQKKMSDEVIKILENKNYKVATKLLPVKTFWPAENYHQDYYGKNQKAPYCHRHEKIF